MMSGPAASVDRVHLEIVSSNTSYFRMPECNRYAALARPIVSRLAAATLNRQCRGSFCCNAEAARNLSIQSCSNLFRFDCSQISVPSRRWSSAAIAVKRKGCSWSVTGLNICAPPSTDPPWVRNIILICDPCAIGCGSESRPPVREIT